MFDKAFGAKAHLETSLQLLDDAGVPDEIGAYVDLAVHRLNEWLGTLLDHSGLTLTDTAAK